MGGGGGAKGMLALRLKLWGGAGLPPPLHTPMTKTQLGLSEITEYQTLRGFTLARNKTYIYDIYGDGIHFPEKQLCNFHICLHSPCGRTLKGKNTPQRKNSFF